MKNLFFKLTIFAACLASMVLQFSACRDRFSSGGYALELPPAPGQWVSLLGEPHWRIEWLDSGGKMQSKDVPPGKTTEVDIPVTWANPVTAWPHWPEHDLIPKFFKPAGALFPYDVSGNSLQLSWKAGADTVFYWELAFANDTLAAKIPANFDWLRFRELFETDALKEAVREDPWLVDWRTVAEKTISSNFDRRRLVPQPTEEVSIPVPGGFWYGTSPFAQPLFFSEDETPVFPVCPGINVWISKEGVLRINGKTWVFRD